MTHDVNLLILANRQVHAQLMSRVRSAEARRVKEDRARWEERREIHGLLKGTWHWSAMISIDKSLQLV